MKIKPLLIALSVSSITLYGCGGDSDGDSTAPPSPPSPDQNTSYSVTALDGYLQKAEVWLDINKNFVWDDGEPKAITGKGGKAELDVGEINGEPQDYPLVVKAIAGLTIDEDNPDVPIPDNFMMSAPSGKDVVSPLTTLVDITMRRDNINEDEATESVAALVGIDKELILSDFAEDKESEAAKIAQQTAKSLVSAGVLPKDGENLDQNATGTSDDLVDGALNVGTVLQQDRENSGDDYDYSKIVTKGGTVDSDSDKDGVPDADDAFKDDKTESKDSDGDKVGDNADLFDDDPTEWADKDGDKVGDNADVFDDDPTEWADSDGDEVGDNADLFDDDPTEWADKDGDKVGDNADVFDDDPTEWADKDGDKVGDNADLFDDDPTEWADKDGDKVGDNADLFDDDPTEWADRDGDKVGDNSDMFPDDPSEWADDDNDGIGNNKDIDNIPVSDKTPADFLSANNRFAVFEFETDDLYYQNIHWSSTDYVTVLDEYIFDNELNTFTVDDEDENRSEFILTTTGEWKPTEENETFKLIPQPDGSLIDQNLSTGEEQTAKGKELLLNGRNIRQILAEKGGAEEMVLKIPADATFSADATALELNWQSQSVQHVLFNWDCYDDKLPETDTGFTNCNTVYQFRGFPADGSPHNDGPALTLDSLIVESAGETGSSMDFLGFSPLMESVSTQLYADNTGAFYYLSWQEPYNYHRLSTNLSWSEQTVYGQRLFVLQTSEPEYKEHINNAFFVELEGYVRMGRKVDDTEEPATVLLFNSVAEQDILNAIGAIELPETLTATCGDAYNYPPRSTPQTAVPQAYLDAITACNVNPLPASSFNNGSRFVRLNSSGEPRGYEFHDDGTWTYYKRGLKGGTRNYIIDPGNPQLLLWSDDNEFAAYAVTDYAADGARNVLIWEQFLGEEDDPDYPDPNLYYAEHWPSIMYSYGEDWMDLCEKLDSGWDNTHEQPLVPRTADEFEQAVNDCQAWWGDRRPKFTIAMLEGRKLVIDSEEYIQFPAEVTLPATYFDGSEPTSINWAIDEQGRLQLSSINQSYQASESWVISDTDGTRFSAKVFHQNSVFSNTGEDQGEIWSTFFHLE